MFRVVLPPIIRSAYSCIYSIFITPLLLSAAIVEELEPVECAVGGVRHPQHTPDDGWKYHPKHVEQFPDINKLCNVVSCWIYKYIGILLGAYPILYISRIRVNIILPCTPLSSKWRLFASLPDQSLKHLSSPHMCFDAPPISSFLVCSLE
jgi:hypothetical protein